MTQSMPSSVQRQVPSPQPRLPPQAPVVTAPTPPPQQPKVAPATVEGDPEQPPPPPDSFECLVRQHGRVETVHLTSAEFAGVASKYKDEPIVIFLPRVVELARKDKKWNALRSTLEKSFNMDSFFLTEGAYESNGFFRYHSGDEKDAWASRFLVKELAKAPHDQALNAARISLYKCIVGPHFDKIKHEGEQSSDIVAIEYANRPKAIRDFTKGIGPTAVAVEIKAMLEDVFLGTKYYVPDEPCKSFQRKHEAIEIWAREPGVQKNLDSLGDRKRLRLFEMMSEFLLRVLHAEDCLLEHRKSVAATVAKTRDQEMDRGWLLMPAAPHLRLEPPKGQIQRSSTVPIPAARRFTEVNASTYDPILPKHLVTSASKTEAAESIKTQGRVTTDLNTTTPQPGTAEKALAEHLRINYTYHWLYLSFWAITLHAHGSSLPVLLCFDDANSHRFKDIIGRNLELRAFASPKTTALVSILLEETLHIFDEALWGFRKPVRNFEKRRQEHLLEREDDKSGYQIHFEIHELSRHLIHSQETLGAAQTVMEAMKNIIKPGDTQFGGLLDLVHFSLTFINNLRLRAGAFVERINNETSLAYDIMNFKQLQSTQRLLQESRNDGKELTKALALISIFFLPGTYFSGVFGMDYFDGKPYIIYVWAGLTGGFTCLLMLALFGWSHFKKATPSFLKI